MLVEREGNGPAEPMFRTMACGSASLPGNPDGMPTCLHVALALVPCSCWDRLCVILRGIA